MNSGGHSRVAVFLWLAVVFFCLTILPKFLDSWAQTPDESSEKAQPPVPAEYVQPIEFSHKIHADKAKIPCEFCHIYARRSIVSGVPPMSLCYGCHSHIIIPGSDKKQKKLLRRLMEIQKRGKPILWKKIHDLPDYVYFSHKRHIQAGMDCTDCHGEVYKYDALSPNTMITNLSMGWCMKCHITGRPSRGGKIIGPVREFRGGKILRKVSTRSTGEVLRGPTDCYACHK